MFLNHNYEDTMCKSVHNIWHMLYNCKLARYIWDGLQYEITMKDILLYANPENDENPDNINYCTTNVNIEYIVLIQRLNQLKNNLNHKYYLI